MQAQAKYIKQFYACAYAIGRVTRTPRQTASFIPFYPPHWLAITFVTVFHFFRFLPWSWQRWRRLQRLIWATKWPMPSLLCQLTSTTRNARLQKMLVRCQFVYSWLASTRTGVNSRCMTTWNCYANLSMGLLNFHCLEVRYADEGSDAMI